MVLCFFMQYALIFLNDIVTTIDDTAMFVGNIVVIINDTSLCINDIATFD